jgi:hypothetical protein
MGFALTAGVLAGLLSWAAGEYTNETFKAEEVETRIELQTIIQSTLVTENRATTRNATLAFTILGCVTGLALGFAGGLVAGSVRRGSVVGIAGAVLGALAGFLGSMAFLRIFFRHQAPNPNDLWTPILGHGGIWAAIAAAGAISFVAGVGRWRRLPEALLGACGGAILATIAFHVLCTALFPDARSTEPLSNSAVVRLIGRLLVTVLIAAGAAKGVESYTGGKAARAAEV